MDMDRNEAPGKPSNPEGLDDRKVAEELKAGGCVICNNLEKLTFEFLAQWQHRLVSDENTQNEYADEFGFCPSHTWQLAALGSPRGISCGYPRLLEKIACDLSNTVQTSRNWPDDISRLVKGSEDCRLCGLLKDREQGYALRLAGFLEKEHVRIAYGKSQGACLRHLTLIVSFLNSREDSSFLMSHAVKRLRETAKEMRSFVLKHDALEKHLIDHSERYAYLRALVHIAGAKNVHVPRISQC